MLYEIYASFSDICHLTNDSEMSDHLFNFVASLFLCDVRSIYSQISFRQQTSFSLSLIFCLIKSQIDDDVILISNTKSLNYAFDILVFLTYVRIFASTSIIDDDVE
jgi:hypothetical protein